MSVVLAATALLALALVAWPGGTVDESDRRATVEAARSSPGSESPSTVADLADAVVLLALVLRSGAPALTALDRVAEVTSGQVRADLRSVAAAERWGLPPHAVWGDLSDHWRPVAIAWQAAHRAGVPPSRLLLSASERVREAELARLERRLQRAGVLLVFPLGGLFLPGFVATTVVPIVSHVLRTMA